MRPRMLADDLADLISPAPGPELDPDELGLGDAAATAAADEQLLGLLQDQGPARQVGTPQGLGLRGAQDLAADPAYSGRRSSRAALFGGDDPQPLMNGFGSTSSSSDDEVGGGAAAGDAVDDPASRYLTSPEESAEEGGPVPGSQQQQSSQGQPAGAQQGSQPYMNGVAGHTSSSSESEQPDAHEEETQEQSQQQPQQQPQQQQQQPQAAPQPHAGGGLGSAEETAASSSSEEEEEEEEAPQQQFQAASPMAGGEEELGDAGAGSEEEEGGDAQGVDEELAAVTEFRDDPALQELDRQHEAMQAAAAPPLAQVAERAAREAAKGAAVAAQRALWERTLHLRILLQRPVAAAAALPRGDVASLFRASQPEVNTAYQQLLGSCAGLLEDLLQLHSAAASQHPAAAAALATASQPLQPDQQPGGMSGGRKRSHAAASASDQQQHEEGSGGLSGALWAQVEGTVAGLAPFRDAAMDKWHRRTVLSSGGAALSGNSLRALQQGVSKQVATLLADPTKVVRRSQLPASLAPRPLGALPQQQQQQRFGVGDDCLPGADAAGGEEERDVDTYDDGDFYQQLLKELLESSGEGARAAAGAGAPKRRKLVDRRASKGRKIRYHVLDKLVNFMAPVELVPPPFATQLFSNLFGYKQRAVE